MVVTNSREDRPIHPFIQKPVDQPPALAREISRHMVEAEPQSRTSVFPLGGLQVRNLSGDGTRRNRSRKGWNLME